MAADQIIIRAGQILLPQGKNIEVYSKVVLRQVKLDR